MTWHDRVLALVIFLLWNHGKSNPYSIIINHLNHIHKSSVIPITQPMLMNLFDSINIILTNGCKHSSSDLHWNEYTRMQFGIIIINGKKGAVFIHPLTSSYVFFQKLETQSKVCYQSKYTRAVTRYIITSWYSYLGTVTFINNCRQLDIILFISMY